MLDLGKQFRPSTSITYPPFKKGRYMEEYFYEYYTKNQIKTDRVYIPIFWTNLQNHPGFASQKRNYNILLDTAIKNVLKTAPNTTFFTVVQHDDGPQLTMAADVLVFGACTGNIPRPLIYEDTNETLMNATNATNKKYIASFIGSNTHPLRKKICDIKADIKADIFITSQSWTPQVAQSAADLFIEKTLESKFCLAPRGYGRSSFRFFEAIILNTIPVYFWDDIEWLPYKNVLDYSKFSVSIHEKDIPRTYEILTSISDETYVNMLKELQNVKHYFTLEYMCKYIREIIKGSYPPFHL